MDRVLLRREGTFRSAPSFSGSGLTGSLVRPASRSVRASHQASSRNEGNRGMVKTTNSASDDDKAGREEAVPVVEEELSVGKREVSSGGVRVTSSVEERPVEGTVGLREEKVEADRRPADRELSAEEAEAAFQEKTVEMMGTREEAEVSKTARVVGEVSLNKRTGEREQTVRDTVRRTEVEVEEPEPSLRKPG